MKTTLGSAQAPRVCPIQFAAPRRRCPDHGRAPTRQGRAARPGRGELPIILLTGRAGIQCEDDCVIGAVKRPAGVHDLYRILQRQFEERPRSTPRIDTELRATCHRRGKSWQAEVLSLSDNGCLLRSGEAIPLGTVLSMSIELPGESAVEVEAETAYQLVPDLGLVFSGTPPAIRERLGAYVLGRLAA